MACSWNFISENRRMIQNARKMKTSLFFLPFVRHKFTFSPGQAPTKRGGGEQKRFRCGSNRSQVTLCTHNLTFSRFRLNDRLSTDIRLQLRQISLQSFRLKNVKWREKKTPFSSTKFEERFWILVNFIGQHNATYRI